MKEKIIFLYLNKLFFKTKVNYVLKNLKFMKFFKNRLLKRFIILAFKTLSLQASRSIKLKNQSFLL